MALKRDAAKARRPLAPRWASGNGVFMTLKKFFALCVLFLLAGIANASDWQYFGANIVAQQQVLQFFDAESISRPSKDFVRVWTKAMRMKDFDHYFRSHKQEVIQKAGGKMATGYSSSYLLLPEVGKQFADETARKDAAIDLIVYEVVANAPEIRSQSKIYYEIDCVENRIKVLSMTLFADNAASTPKSGGSQRDYDFIVPDSAGQWLKSLVCLAH